MQSNTHGALIAKQHLSVQEMTTLLVETFEALPSVAAVQVSGSELAVRLSSGHVVEYAADRLERQAFQSPEARAVALDALKRCFAA
jgi:hypothetical protein